MNLEYRQHGGTITIYVDGAPLGEAAHRSQAGRIMRGMRPHLDAGRTPREAYDAARAEIGAI